MLTDATARPSSVRHSRVPPNRKVEPLSTLGPVHRRLSTVATACFALLVVPLLLALSAPQQPQKPVNRYIGAAQCKTCHDAKATGDQHGAWQKEKHSKAFATLASDKAKTLAKE